MRNLLFLVLLLPISVVAQKQDVFLKLTDAKGIAINGDAFTKGFERTIQAFTISTGGKNNTQLNFTMSISGASAEFKKSMTNGDFLLNGLATVLEQNTVSAPRPIYTIKMEKIKVISCTETMGCNGAMTTTVTLQATRIGWTYYQSNRTGVLVVSNKYGYDAETGAQWTNF